MLNVFILSQNSWFVRKCVQRLASISCLERRAVYRGRPVLITIISIIGNCSNDDADARCARQMHGVAG